MNIFCGYCKRNNLVEVCRCPIGTIGQAQMVELIHTEKRYIRIPCESCRQDECEPYCQRLVLWMNLTASKRDNSP